MTARDLAKTCISCAHFREDDSGLAVCGRTQHRVTREDLVNGRVIEEFRSVACGVERAGRFIVLLTLLFDRRRLCGRGGHFWTPRAAGTTVVTATASAEDQEYFRPYDDQPPRFRFLQHPLFQFLRRYLMPRRRSLYEQLAIEYGHVDPDDPEAIEHFYEVTIHTLPPDVSAEIMDRLIAADDMFDTGEEPIPGCDSSGRRYEDLPHVPPPKAAPPGDLEAYMAELRRHGDRMREAERRAGHIDTVIDELHDVFVNELCTAIRDNHADAGSRSDNRKGMKMAFRIDRVFKGHDGAWACDFKGVNGNGSEGRLTTDARGCGLYLQGPPGNEPVVLLPPTQYFISPTLGHLLAWERFTAALWFLKWGPEVREDGPKRADKLVTLPINRPAAAMEESDDTVPREQRAEDAVAEFCKRQFNHTLPRIQVNV